MGSPAKFFLGYVVGTPFLTPIVDVLCQYIAHLRPMPDAEMCFFRAIKNPSPLLAAWSFDPNVVQFGHLFKSPMFLVLHGFGRGCG